MFNFRPIIILLNAIIEHLFLRTLTLPYSTTLYSILSSSENEVNYKNLSF